MLITIFHSATGLVHLASAIAALVLGTAVLLLKKGTVLHKRLGYGYVVAMVLVNVTAFMIYRLFGNFGPFHIAAVFSSITIVGGIVPALLKRYVSSWIYFHYFFMNWSVVGLYAAFWAETLVRLFPMKQFWPVVAVATGLTTFIGGRLISRYKSVFLKPTTSTPVLSK